jgi:site-specific DNA-cytosine methylase
LSITHASLIPLIGGETLGSEEAFGARPEYIISYKPFQNHDRHLLNWYEYEVPYILLDEGRRPDYTVDVVSSVCPCAGLSMLSQGYGDHNENNKWMIESAKYVLGELKPQVYWGENAPGFAGKIGKNVRTQLFHIGREHGYSLQIYRTKSLLHGLSQIRERSFYFFWRGEKLPLFSYFNREHEKIEDTILSASGNTQREPINSKTPSKDDPYYRYILEVLHGGIAHRDFAKLVEPANTGSNDVMSYIERSGHDYPRVAEWMRAQGYEKEYERCHRKDAKLKAGGNIMRRGTIVPKDYIGAFVGHYPTALTHPVEDRYIDYREAMTIMGLPQNFELLDAKKNYNHVCQNVPVQTARDMASEVRAALEGCRDFIRAECMFQYNHNRKHEVETVTSDFSTIEEFLV